MLTTPQISVVHFERLVICSLVSLLFILLSVYWFDAGKSAGKILLRLVVYNNSSTKQPGLPVAENMDRNEDFWEMPVRYRASLEQMSRECTLAAY